MMRSNKFFRACADAACAAIQCYRAVLSLDHGVIGAVMKRSLPFGFISFGCRFTPSCSAYAEDAIRQYGLAAGVMVSCRRILRCHPWSVGGYDPVGVSRIKNQL